MALIFRELGKAVCLKSILLSLFLCASALAQWDTNAWSGDYFRVLPDGTPTLHQIIDDALAATVERGEVVEITRFGFGEEGVFFPVSSSIQVDKYRSTLRVSSSWEPDNRIPIETNTTFVALDEIKDALQAYLVFAYDPSSLATGGFDLLTTTGLCASLSIPTNYFDYTPPRFLDIPEASMSSFPTNENTLAGFTMADYGWHYIDDICNEIRYFDLIDNGNPITPDVESVRYNLDAITEAADSDVYKLVVEASTNTCRTTSLNTGSPLTFENITYSFSTNSLVTNTSLNVYTLSLAEGESFLNDLSYDLNDGESYEFETLTTDFTSPETNLVAVLMDNYSMTVTNDPYSINYNALFYVKYSALGTNSMTFDMDDYSTLAQGSNPSECGVHSVSFNQQTITKPYSELPFYSEISEGEDFKLIGSNIFTSGVSSSVSYTNHLGVYNQPVTYETGTLEGLTDTYSGDTWTNTYNNSYYYDQIKINYGTSGNNSKNITGRKVIVDFSTPGGFDYQ